MAAGRRPEADQGDAALVARIVGEYFEMPGLSLTIEQACRLRGCDATTCRRITATLLARSVLRWSRDDRLVRAR
jgi:hypothetical protein